MSPAGTSRRMCRKCGEGLALGEKRCPNCGTLYKKKPESISPYWWGIIIFMILFGAILAYIIRTPNKPPPPKNPAPVPTVAAPKAPEPAVAAPKAPAPAPAVPK